MSGCPGWTVTDFTYVVNKEKFMQQIDDIVSGWLSGAEGGMENPAGPLYIEGTSATEAALTDSSLPLFTRCSSCSASSGGQCC